jgi:hypothetical protein
MRSFLIGLILCLWSVGAHAQEIQTGQAQCGTPESIAGALSGKYHEQVMFRGLSGQGTMMVELWGEPDGTTFSIVYTYQKEGVMKSCLVGAGSESGDAS